MYYAISLIKSFIAPTFDEDIRYKDADEDIDNNHSTSHRKIRINTPQNWDNLILQVRTALYKS
ncbi:9783_t:CDS:2 [Gigaspora rosea]|nr:9783_t:CDS:2 [Gigaspora rosea]